MNQNENCRPTVVMAHGWCNTGKHFFWLGPRLERAGFRVLAPDLKPACGAAGIEPLAWQLKNLIEKEVPEDAPLYLLGFSMGGLISRYYLQRLDGLRRARRLVCIASPHSGSLLAWFVANPGGRQMRPGSAFLRDLDSDRERLTTAIPVLNLWTPFDLMVIPATHTQFAPGENRMVLSPLHPLMLMNATVLAAVLEFLRADMACQQFFA